MIALLRYWKLAAVAVALAGAFVSGVKVSNWRHDALELAVQKAADAASQKVSKDAVDAIAKIEVRNVTIRQKAETITREVPVYRDCRNDPRVFDGINQALTEPGTAAPSLPAANPDDR